MSIAALLLNEPVPSCTINARHKQNSDPRSDLKAAVHVCWTNYGCTSNAPTSYKQNGDPRSDPNVAVHVCCGWG
jgi:hypothetical protein